MNNLKNESDWEQTFHKLKGDLLSQAARLLGDASDAEDVVQDTYLKALEFSRQGRTIHDPERWLRRTVRNTAIDRLRTRKNSVQPDEFAPIPNDEGSLALPLQDCLGPLARALPTKFSEALLRTDLGDGRMVDLAEEQKIGLSAAKSRVQRARNQLASEIKRCCETVAAPSEPYLRSLGHNPCCPVVGPIKNDGDSDSCCS